MQQLIVIDTGTESQDYSADNVWQEVGTTRRFIFVGDACLEYSRNSSGEIDSDEYGQPQVATYVDSDGNSRPKHGPILMEWNPTAFAVTSSDGAYSGYRGAWVASGGSGMRPHSHVSVNEGYVITNGIY